MYRSVAGYFKKRFPHLAPSLDNSGAFWPAVKANTISNKELAQAIYACQVTGQAGSHVFQAATALLSARLIGVVPDPERSSGRKENR